MAVKQNHGDSPESQHTTNITLKAVNIHDYLTALKMLQQLVTPTSTNFALELSDRYL